MTGMPARCCPYRSALRGLLLALSIGLLSVPSTSFADDDRVEALEARVAELEALVRQLVESGAAPVSPVESSADADRAARQAQATAEQTARDTALAVLAEQQEIEAAKADKHSWKIGGYVKLDALYSDYSGGSVASNNPGRDFYIPGTVPVGGVGQSYLDFHAKQTRIYFQSNHNLDSGDVIKTYVELDFLVGSSGDERISNSYNPRMRQAYFTWNNWLFGQAWNTIFNVGSLPDNLDFVGPSESTVFGRQAMIRYTKGPWQFAVENPETTITPFGGGRRIAADDATVPDAVVRYNASGDWGQWSIAGILRQLRYDNPAQGIDSTTTGFGVSAAGKFLVGERDDVRWMVSAGKGLGRYVGLNIVNGAVLDAQGELETIDTVSGFLAYRHFWNERWRSSVTVSYLDVSNDTALTGDGVTSSGESLHFNLIYNPIPKLDIGVEYIFGSREIESGISGDLNRYQFSARYSY